MRGGDGGKEGGKEGGQQEGGARKGGGGKAMTFPELMFCMYVVLGTNERFSAGKGTAVRLSTSNSAYTQRVKWMKEHDNWRYQHGMLRGTWHRQSQVVLGAGHTRASLGSNWAGARPGFPS